MIEIENNGDGTATCVKCHGVEDVLIRDDLQMKKHLEDFHDWPVNDAILQDLCDFDF